MKLTTLTLDGREYVVIARDEYDRLVENAAQVELPPFPKADRRGNVPATAYTRASIARTIIRDRAACGLSREALAKLAAVRLSTLVRIESGAHDASTPTIDKLDRVLQRRLHARNGRRRS